MYRYLFFDADGTLFDFNKAEEQAFFLMGQELNLQLQASHLASYKACNAACWKEFEQGTLSLNALKTKRFESFGNTAKLHLDPYMASKIYQAHLSEQGILYAHSRSTLATLQERGYALYLASNGIADVQWGRIHKAALAPFFTQIFISEELGSQKPDPSFFSTMLGMAGLQEKKQECLMIGDSLASDIQGAHDSGIDSVWLNRDKSPLPSGVSPTFIHTSLSSLLDVLTGPR